jgi:cyanophycinase-like exopeptidase
MNRLPYAIEPPLIRLLTDEHADENMLEVSRRADGTKEYAVIIRSNHSEEIKKMGGSVSSVFGDVIVARVTTKELRKIVSLLSVRAIQVGSKNTIQHRQP